MHAQLEEEGADSGHWAVPGTCKRSLNDSCCAAAGNRGIAALKRKVWNASETCTLTDPKAMDYQETSYAALPGDVQSTIFALAGAPLDTCRAAAAIPADPALPALWLLNSRIQQPLLRAAQHKLWPVCHAILDTQYQPPLEELQPALSHAAAEGQLGLIHKLLEAGPPAAELLSCDSATAWRMWDENNWPEFSPWENRLEDPEHPLICAARNGHADICRLLLREGRDTHLPVIQALCSAARHGHAPVVQLMCEPTTASGQLLDHALPWLQLHTLEQDSDRHKLSRALHAAAEGGQLQVMRLLVQQGADVDYQCEVFHSQGSRMTFSKCFYPFTAAAAKGNLEAMQLLLDLGCQPTNWVWRAALHQAIKEGRLEGMRCVLDRAPPAAVTSDWGRSESPLICVIHSGNPAAAELLLQSGKQVWKEGDLEVSLYYAAAHGYLPLMQLLIQHGANVDGPVDEVMKRRPLGYAIDRNQSAAVSLLVQAGASHLQEALSYAAQKQRLGPVRVLLEHGVQDTDDRALFYATSHHIAWPLVRRLLHAPLSGTASAQEQGNQLSTRLGVALCGAAGVGNKEVLQKLLEYAKHLAASTSAPLLSKDVLNQAAAMAASRQRPVLYVHPSGRWGLNLGLSHCKERKDHMDFPGVVKLLTERGADITPDCDRLLRRRPAL